tara:strand:+ start:2320 stop:2649 length:330 start_codon:yes stop_codon:yes gene_type:complete
MKNTITLRFTDEQYYFLKEIAKSQHRTLEELLWLFLEHGYYCYGEEHDLNFSVHKKEDEFTDEEKEKMKKWDSGGTEQKEGNYVCRYHDADKIREVLKGITSNVLDFRK